MDLEESTETSLTQAQVQAVQLLHAYATGEREVNGVPIVLETLTSTLKSVLGGPPEAASGTRYDAYPDHPLYGVPEETLEVAREVLRGGVLTKDVEEEHADALADAVVAELREAGKLTLAPNPAAARWRRR